MMPSMSGTMPGASGQMPGMSSPMPGMPGGTMPGMSGGMMSGGMMQGMSTGEPFKINGKGYRDPETEQPRLGTTEIWRFINATTMTHPMHVHLVQFQVLDRQSFQRGADGKPVYDAGGRPVLEGSPRPPNANEAGWKDTVAVLPGEVTRIIMRFDSYTGTYVLHCHILEHEEGDMMRPFTVVP
jgi:spore coat protein A